MNIALAFMVAMQAPAPANGISFSCQPSHGDGFSIFVPFNPPANASASESSPYYRVRGLGEIEAPRSVIGSLSDGLSMFWRNEDGDDVILDLVRYNAASGRVRYRLRQESGADSPIVTVTSSDGVCVTQGNVQ